MSRTAATLLRIFASIVAVLLVTNGLIYFQVVAPEHLALWTVWVAFGCIFPFVLIYGFTVKWWTFWIGRALLISSVAFAALTGLSVLLQWLGPKYWGRTYIVNSVLTLIAIGAAAKLFAVLNDKIPLWLGRRERHGGGSPGDTS